MSGVRSKYDQFVLGSPIMERTYDRSGGDSPMIGSPKRNDEGHGVERGDENDGLLKL